jgi:hypothetical protein
MESRVSSTAEPEKNSTDRYEVALEADGITGFETDEAHLPHGYYTSTFFIGTMTAISIGFFAGVAGFGLLAPILLVINADIGPVRLALLRIDGKEIC